MDGANVGGGAPKNIPAPRIGMCGVDDRETHIFWIDSKSSYTHSTVMTLDHPAKQSGWRDS